MTKLIETTREVYNSIMKEHMNELKVFSSYSAPCGDMLGDKRKGVMMTEWGFEGANRPIINLKSTWEVSFENEWERRNEKTEYWLVVSVSEDE